MWLYLVTIGATTIWERWNSYREGIGFGDVSIIITEKDETVYDVKSGSYDFTVIKNWSTDTTLKSL